MKETERPWKPEVDQLQQTMREVLRAVAGFSGVELPGLPSGPQDGETPSPCLNFKTLKDRFRNDLEGFSIKTTEELSKRAKEQTRTALEAVQNEMGGMVDQVAAEFRQDLQIPAQIEKLLEPCVEDAEARLQKSITQKFEQLVAQHEQLVQEKLQGTISSVQAQMNALEQTVQEIRDLKAELAGKSPAEQSNRAAEVEHLLAEHDQLVQGRLREALSPVQTQISTLERTVQQVREQKGDAVPQSSAAQPSVAEVAGRIDQLAAEFRQRLHDQTQMEKLLEPRVGEAEARLEKSICQKVEKMFAEREQTAQEKAQGAPVPIQNQVGTFEEAEARLERSICQRVEHLVAQHEQLVQEKLQETLSSVQTQISALEQTVQQIRDLKAAPVAKLPAEQLVAATDNATRKAGSSLNNGLQEFLDQSFSRLVWSFNNVPESPSMQSTQSIAAGQQHNAIQFNDAELQQRRVQEALDRLGQLGPKDTYRPS